MENELTSEVAQESVQEQSTAQPQETTAQVDPPVGDSSEAQEYTPNYKYKVLDKEYEFDAELKDAIKSKNIETKLRELYTKSAGIDTIKQDRESLRTKIGDYEKQIGEYSNVMKGLNTINHFYNNKDWDNFFQALKISDQDLYQYIYSKLNRSELPKDAQAQYNNSIQVS